MNASLCMTRTRERPGHGIIVGTVVTTLFLASMSAFGQAASGEPLRLAAPSRGVATVVPPSIGPSPDTGASPMERLYALRSKAEACRGAGTVEGWLLLREGWPLADMAAAAQLTLQTFYRDRGFKPAWICADGTFAKARKVLAILENAHRHGLTPTAYPTGDTARRLTSMTQHELLRTDVMLSAALYRFALDLKHGRIRPDLEDGESLEERTRGDGVSLLRDLVRHPQILSRQEFATWRGETAQGLERSLADYRAIARRGGWKPVSEGETLRIGDVDPRVAAIRMRLLATGDLDAAFPGLVMNPEIGWEDPGVSAVGAFDAFGWWLEHGVRRFQARHGLEVDGIVGDGTRSALNIPVATRIRQIEVNLERERWAFETRPGERIEVNVPGYELRLIRDDRQILRMKVIVGLQDRPTPMLKATLRSLVLNPYWHVPFSIARRDILPAARRDAGFLHRQGFQVVSPDGHRIPINSIDWARQSGQRFPYLLRQRPGVHNSLGRIKFDMPNRHAIFLHDTPKRSLFGRAERSFSSGCIRVEDPVRLATVLMNGHRNWTKARINEVIENGRNTRVSLPDSIAVYLDYRTAWRGEAGETHFRRDLYGRDQRLAEALNAISSKEKTTQVSAR